MKRSLAVLGSFATKARKSATRAASSLGLYPCMTTGMLFVPLLSGVLKASALVVAVVSCSTLSSLFSLSTSIGIASCDNEGASLFKFPSICILLTLFIVTVVVVVVSCDGIVGSGCCCCCGCCGVGGVKTVGDCDLLISGTVVAGNIPGVVVITPPPPPPPTAAAAASCLCLSNIE